MNVVLIDAESRRAIRERSDNPNAVDLAMRGMAIINKPSSRENTQRARELFETALRLKPDICRPSRGWAK